MDNEKPYPTDEFGRPDGRNYHYRIPLDDQRALRKVRIAEKIKGRFIERDCCNGDSLYHTCVQTHDNKGPISGLGEYEYSKQWEKPFGPGKHESLRIRYNTGGGTKIKGPIHTGEEYGTVEINTAVDLTVGEVKDAEYGTENHDKLMEAIHWAVEDALEKERERIWQSQQECDHEHMVTDESLIGIVGYCEDCNREWRDLEELPA